MITYMKNLNIKQYHQAYHPYEIPANNTHHQQQQTQLQHPSTCLNPYNTAVPTTTTPTNQRFNNAYNLPTTASNTNLVGCKTLPTSINNHISNQQQTLTTTPPPPTLGGYLANQQQLRLQQQQQQQQLQQNFNQHLPTTPQQINMLSLNQTNTFNYNFHFNANNNHNNTSHNLNISNNNNNNNTKYNNHNNSALSRPQRPNSLNISTMASLATPSCSSAPYSFSSTAPLSNNHHHHLPSTCHSAPTTGVYNFSTPNNFYNNQRENLFNFHQQHQQQQHHQQQQQHSLHHNNNNYNTIQQHQQNYNNYQTNQQQQQQLQQFQLLQQQLKQQQQLHINNNNNNTNSNSNNGNLTTPAVSSSAAIQCSSSATISSSTPSTSSSNNAVPITTSATAAAVNSNSDQTNNNNNCDKLTMDACEIANFLANELFMQQLVSMECMQTGVPTLTTPTLTPTTLKSIEESFIQLTSEPMNAPYQAGFIPPPLGSYNATTTNSNSNNNNNSTLTTVAATTTSVAGISPNAALNNVYLGDISAGASLPDYGNMTESENSQGSWTASAATDTISFQNGLNGLGVNNLNNSNSSTTNDFTTVNLAALAVATAAAKISNSGNNNNNTSSSATTTSATPTRRGGGRRPATNSNMSPEEEEKRRIRRERNKLAAARCRKRRVDQTNELTEEVQMLEKKREELQKQIESLNGTKQDLEFLLEAHRPTCQRVVPTDILSVNTFEGLMPSATSTANDNITGVDTSLATTARSISPLDLKPVLNDQLLAQIKAEPLDTALDSNSSLDQDGPSSPKRFILSNNNTMIPPPLPNVATLSPSLAAAAASLNTPIVTTAPVSFGSMYSNNPSLSAPLTKPNSKQRPNSLPTVPRNLAQTIGLNDNDNKPRTDINGVAIQTPSTGMFNFDSLMDGGTGLTPVSGPLVPTCSSQNKHPLELVTPTSEPSNFSLALYCHALNMTVISACHNVNSEGAKMLQHLNDPKRMITIELDLLKPETIENTQQCLRDVLANHHDYQFTALVNNAGVMCFGEFEWQTWSQIEMQINVNLLGTMRLTRELMPLLRQHQARIINVTSHCGLQALPSTSPYAASKAGLRFWTDSLRIEMQSYGVEVVNFIPGSFVMSSNICARQQDHAKLMYNNFSSEQREFYGAYFKRFNDYLNIISGFKPANSMHDKELLDKFKDALTNTQPKAIYKMYRFLFAICPTPVVDWLCIKFCAMPTYQQVERDTKHHRNNNIRND
ncbi:Transcription factor kayak [Lucilia cuprina]|nr:Transcription factor kayak [Lucilia cuprina]